MEETSPDLREFYGEALHVGIVSIFDVGSGKLARAIIEDMDAIAHLHPIGTPAGFLRLISAGEHPPYLVLTGHGDENGICFGEFSPEIDTSSLKDGSLSTSEVAKHGNFQGVTVINTLCESGSRHVAYDFLKAGAMAYIGTSPNPDWRATSMFLHLFFYSIVRHGVSDEQAWWKAASFDADTSAFLYYDVDDCHRAEVA